MKIPKASMTSLVDSTVELQDGFDKLCLKSNLLPLTLGILDDQIIVDPTLDEMELIQTQMTLVFDHELNVIHLYKPGGCQVSVKDLQTIFKLGHDRVKELISLLDKLT